MDSYKVVLADDHKFLRSIIRKILSTRQECEVVGEAGDGLSLLDLLEHSDPLPEMVILDLSMPGMPGIDAARRIHSDFPDVKVLILTVHREREFVRQAIDAGADGYLLKDDANTEIFKAIRAIRQGGTYYSSRIPSPAA